MESPGQWALIMLFTVQTHVLIFTCTMVLKRTVQHVPISVQSLPVTAMTQFTSTVFKSWLYLRRRAHCATLVRLKD
jgi:hypothetical protein